MDIYLVGGAVRDALLNLPVHERDWVVVGATPEQLLAEGFKPVGKDFPVFLHPKTQEEYALARTERKTGKGYHGFECYAAADVTLEDDLKRRDLTINAMAQAKDGSLIDPYRGFDDLQAKLLRHVSESFVEDPVRVLRIARFAARYHRLGFTIAEETQALMATMVTAGEVDNLVAERVWKEMSRALCEPNPEQFFITLTRCGALQRILPELENLLSSQGPLAFAHLQHACAVSERGDIRFACFFHLLEQEADTLAPLCQRLAIPNDYRDLALMVAAHKKLCHQIDTVDAEALLRGLEIMDAFRRPERVDDFLLCCEAEAEFVNRQPSYPQAQQFKQWLRACQSVTAAQVDTQRFQGKAIGDEIHRLRLDILRTGLSDD